jgi:hypothetical protein
VSALSFWFGVGNTWVLHPWGFGCGVGTRVLLGGGDGVFGVTFCFSGVLSLGLRLRCGHLGVADCCIYQMGVVSLGFWLCCGVGVWVLLGGRVGLCCWLRTFWLRCRHMGTGISVVV